jgi:hypothetical protein
MFSAVVVNVFGPKYLGKPNELDSDWLMAIGATRGCLGMLGSTDFMFWKWKN